METPTNTVRPRPVRRLGLSRYFRGTLLTPSTCSTPNLNKKNDFPETTEKTDTANTSDVSTIDIGDQKQNDTPSSQPNNSENNSEWINSLETPTNTVRLRPIRSRLGEGLFRRTLLTPSTYSTPNSNKKNDFSKTTKKSDTTNTSVIPTAINGDQKQTETPSSQPNNSDNNNGSINSLETPTSSRINQMKFKLSLCKTTSVSHSRKRMQYLKSESLIQPKRLKLDERQLPNETISEIEDQISNCDSGSNPVITSDAQPEDENSLTKAIAELKSKIANIKKYEQRSSELSGLIPKWREAGEKTIEELKVKIQPKQDVKVILHHFNIDPTLFNVDEE